MSESATARSRHPRIRRRDTRHQQRARPKIAPLITPSTSLACGFKPLTEAEVQQIHRAALHLLEQIGMANPTPRIRETALRQGCRLSQSGRLLFPASLVEDTLVNAATQFPVYGRDAIFDFEAKPGQVNFCTGGAAVSMLDLVERTYRPSLLADLYDLARLADTLDNVQWFTRPVVATEISDLFELDVNTIYACAAGTRKHIATSLTKGEHLYQLVPLLDLLGKGKGPFKTRPFCTVHATTVVSPMTFATDSLEVACAAVDIGMPIHCQTGPQAGATAPAALAGTLVQGCAESLASLTLINLLQPGHPVIMGNWVFVSDLRTGAFSGGGGEQALLGAASGQMAAFYGVPGGMGAGMTDSKLPDNQAGFEKALTLLLAALSGGGFVYESVGMLSSLLGCSFESMIIDNDMLSNIRRIAKGIEVTDETLSVSVVADVTSETGHFLGHRQTMDLMESEYVYPQQADRLSPDDWQQNGSRDSWDRATLRAKQILSTHYPNYIHPDTDARIRQQYNIRLMTQSDPAKFS